MANEASIDFLTRQITGMQVVQQELTQIYTSITNPDFADDVRQKLTSLNETLFAMKSARNSMKAATTKVIPPPPPDRVDSLTAALRHLDAYVRNDQNIHMALNYLTQVADLLRQA